MVNGALDRLVYVVPLVALDLFWHSHHRLRCESLLLFVQSVMEIEIAIKTITSNDICTESNTNNALLNKTYKMTKDTNMFYLYKKEFVYDLLLLANLINILLYLMIQ